MLSSTELNRIKGETIESRFSQLRPMANIVNDLISKGKVSSVIDIGCGEGGFIQAINLTPENKIGIDSDPYCEINKLQGFFFSRSISQISKKAELVTLIDVIEHMSFENGEKLLNDIILHCLKDKGFFLIMTNNPLSPIGVFTIFDDPTHVRMYAPKTMESTLIKLGFTIVDSGKITMEPRFNTWLKPLLYLYRKFKYGFFADIYERYWILAQL